MIDKLKKKLSEIEGVHCIGNGKAAAYIKDGDIRELFAPYYTMPPVLSMYRTNKRESDKVTNYRYVTAGVAVTEIKTQEGTAKITDFTVPGEPIYVRKITAETPITFDVKSKFICEYNTFMCKEGKDGVKFGDMMFYIKQGTVVHAYCDVDKHVYCRLIFDDSVQLNITEDGRSLTFPKGESHMMFFGGDAGKSELDSFYNLMELSTKYVLCTTEELFDTCLADWDTYARRIKDYSYLLDNHPRKDEIIETIYSVAMALKTQTSFEGGTLAGEFYHLAYGRDMYGVIRGYLALGLYPEAKAAIEFFITEYRKRGTMPNAVGMGTYGSHCAENDDVEQTGYYLLELADYYKETGDADFLRSAEDYIKFLLEAQEKHLAKGMLPFCGDETYIAGGLLPRACISHGSMESTALYITGSSRILDICKEIGIFDKDILAGHMAKLDECRSLYNDNFIRDGKVVTNNPERVKYATPIRYIHGVCNSCYTLDFLRAADDGGYLCMHCYGKKQSFHTDEYFTVDCATLMTGYVHSQYPAASLTCKLAMDTCMEKINNPSEDNAVGYENGLLLYVLATHGICGEITDKILDNLLATRTSGGVWSEYYRGGVVSQKSCQYRPWESAINLCGIFKLLELEYSKQ